MARINLLPWRDALRKRRQRDFAIATGIAVAVTVALGIAIHVQIATMIANQQERNDFLNAEIARLNRKIEKINALEREKANLVARMEVIQRLQESRPEIVHLFDEVVKAIPEGVFLTRLSQDDKEVVVEGRAQSNARVSAFMRNIEKSGWISTPRLLLIEHKDKTDTGLSHFRLSFEQVRTNDESRSDAG